VNGILAVVGHPDDETFGCGGTLSLHAEKGDQVKVLCLTCNPRSRYNELFEANRILGLSEPIIWKEDEVRVTQENMKHIADQIMFEKPKTVVTHLPFDYHSEHRLTYSLVKEAIEWAAHTTIYETPWLVERLLLMEVNTLIPQPSVLVDITQTMEKKNLAVSSYRTQLAKFTWHYYENWTIKKAELRGIQSGCSYAEAFQEEALPHNSPFYREKSTKSIL